MRWTTVTVWVGIIRFRLEFLCIIIVGIVVAIIAMIIVIQSIRTVTRWTPPKVQCVAVSFGCVAIIVVVVLI